VRKSEKGILVVYANTISRTETDEQTNEETAHDIHYIKATWFFNVEQIDGLTRALLQTDRRRMPRPSSPLKRVERFFAATRADIRHGGDRAYYASGAGRIQMPPPKSFRDRKATIQSLGENLPLDENTRPALTAAWDASAGAMKVTRWKSLSPNLARRSSVPILELTPEPRGDHASYLDHWSRYEK